MLRRFTSNIKTFIKKHRLDALREVAIFAAITIAIHFSWRGWAMDLHYWPIKTWMNDAGTFMAWQVFYQSAWFVDHILGIDITTVEKTLHFANGGSILINKGCSGLKQFTQFALLMAIYPGPWKAKFWYIPLGVLIVHLTNIFRIVGLSVVMVNWHEHWYFSHDYLFRPFFYVIIFTLWVIWVEKFYRKKKSS
jgi:exosortase/archaeosortase family protein